MRITSILILYPYIICFDSDSTISSKLNITLGIAGGKHYPQNIGCGRITNTYYDFRGTIEYTGEKSGSGIKLGMSELDYSGEDYFPSLPADTIKKSILSFSYIIPYFGFADKYAELRIGLFSATGRY